MEKTTIDIINSIGFESMSCIFLSLNVVALYKHKVVKGISITSSSFFALWAIWNVFYYFSLDQRFSFMVAVLVAVLSSWWCVLAIWYRINKTKT